MASVQQRTPPQHPHPYRCGLCRQPGHDRRNCPCTDVEARRLSEEYNRERRQEAVRRRRELEVRVQQTATHNEGWRSEVYAQVVDMQRRLEALTGNGPSRPPPTTPTVRERKVQEILFENAEKIPDGLYKELMDALVLRS